jgi:UDP-N-acetylmuramoyl-tripeptide--D-alanyl-D-alanine ligase
VDALRKGAAGAVVSRDLGAPAEFADRVLLVADTYKALGDLAHYYVTRWGGRVVAITGSNGKTSTKDMVFHAVSGRQPAKKSPSSFNNHVGVPLSIFLLDETDKIAVLEMGTSGPGEIRRLAAIARPGIGVITNVAETHLLELGSLRGVAEAKAELIEALPQDGRAILNADDAMTSWLAQRCPCGIVTFGMSGRADVRGMTMRAGAWGSEFDLVTGEHCSIPVPGRHNVMNALAAIAVCDALGMTRAEAVARLATFAPSPMRLARETVAQVTIINDAYNANICSMDAALHVLREMPVTGRRVMLCGDMLELGPRSDELHRRLGKKICESGVRLLVTAGPCARLAGDVARHSSLGMEVHNAEDAMEAAELLAKMLRPRDVLLVKGSRGMSLERAIESLKSKLQAAGDSLAADGAAVAAQVS